MAAKIVAVGKWDGERIVPAAHRDLLDLQGLEAGTLLTLTKYRPRTDKQNRKVHALLKNLEDNSPYGWTSERIKQEVKLANGWFDGAAVDMGDGKIYVSVRSTADFDIDEMEKFYQQVFDFGIQEVCPGIDPKLLQKTVDNEIAERRG